MVSRMYNYNWRCLACDEVNKKEDSACSYCGCPAENIGDIVEQFRILNKFKKQCCSDGCQCGARSFDVKFDQDYTDYHYSGFKRRIWVFNILSVIIECVECNDKKIIEFEIPFFRRLYRNITKKDIGNERLLRI